MKIFPAIDLYDKKAVRLYKGDYDKMTVYSERPWEIAEDFAAKGASCIHLVDLEGAKAVIEASSKVSIEKLKKVIEEAGFKAVDI